MTSTMAVLTAVRSLIASACPGVEVRGFTESAEKPDRIPRSGVILGGPGDPGDPEIDMSPLIYNFTHTIPVEAVIPVINTDDSALRHLIAPIGTAIIADRTLGGLCMWVDVSAASMTDDDFSPVSGAPTLRTASFDIIAEYAVSNPLAA